MWAKIPQSVKVIIYCGLSLLLTRLTDDMVKGVAFDAQVYYGIMVTYGYNVVLKALKDLQAGLPLEKLQEQFNQEQMGR